MKNSFFTTLFFGPSRAPKNPGRKWYPNPILESTTIAIGTQPIYVRINPNSGRLAPICKKTLKRIPFKL
ncbi:hypothetical protein D7Z94_16020 [Ulvibacterium marinum]|uniref:Uncharacterized protein n=1 Tax=Ulvibacterium marinum TaxID=2419782 RepID=A0A3B0CAE6_9FLAO|nr:hypothetical protein D7Z94_16020 [Ulvibacterium marinum]